MTPEEKWLDKLGLALAAKVYAQAVRVSDTHWTVPRSDGAEGDAHVTVQHGRVVGCSCVAEYGGRWSPLRPCLHAAGVVLQLHAEWWDAAGCGWDWSAIDDIAPAYPVLLGYLPASVGVSHQKEAA